jgi:hypothetical protein
VEQQQLLLLLRELVLQAAWAPLLQLVQQQLRSMVLQLGTWSAALQT